MAKTKKSNKKPKKTKVVVEKTIVKNSQDEDLGLTQRVSIVRPAFWKSTWKFGRQTVKLLSAK